MSKVTLTLLKKIFPQTPNSKLNRFVAPFNEILPKYDISTKKRFAAFIANVGIESDRLKALEEYATGNAYDTRTSLGNTPERDGDGALYKGRSVLQTTGKYNYWKVVAAYLRVLTGKDWKQTTSDFQKYTKSKSYEDMLKEADKYNVNFLKNPELLEEFPHAVEAACIFVKDNNLNSYADKGQFRAYAGVLNTGSPRKKAMHLELRQELYDLAMRVIPDDFNLERAETDTPSTDKTVDSPVVVKAADSVVVNEKGAEPSDSGTVSVSVGGNGDVQVDTTTSSSNQPPKEKMAVVGTKPTKWYTGLGAKITAAITGNALFTWFMDQMEKLQAVALNPMTWKIIIGLVLLGSLIWLGNQIMENRAARKKQKELEALLVEQNSTPDNIISVIPYEDADLFKLKGYKLIRSGESLPSDTEANLPK